jgi:N-carbamoyl-L-amino-acid hydrolase
MTTITFSEVTSVSSHTFSDYQHLRVDGARLLQDFEELAQIGGTLDGGVHRLALSQEDMQARAWYAERVEAAGLRVQDDDAGNLSGVLRSRNPQAKTILLGSHLDTVPNGGRYDGAVGVLAALECLRVIHDASLQLPVHLEAINFTDDEGCWRSLFGSRALAGMLTDEDTQENSADTAAFRAALSRAGIEIRDVANAERPSSTIAAYLELHIEQGERLERAQKHIGVVDDIVGRTTYQITFLGQAGHSGTTPMYRRRDALLGAAEFITRAHKTVRERYGDGVFNCGDIDVKPGAFNIIPSEALVIVECRHIKAQLLAEMEMMTVQIARESAAANALGLDCKRIAHMPAAPMDEGMVSAIEASSTQLGLTTMRLPSLSGHDAQIISRIAPGGMIFIPSVGGISHHADEFSRWDDVLNGANVLLQTLLRVALPA